MSVPEHYWLLPGQLMGGEWPGRHLDWLEYQGVSVIVNLTERSYRDERFRIHRIGVPEGAGPEPPQIRRFCRLVRRALAEDERVYVHCRAGCGRTGAMLAAFLVYRERISADAAIGRVRALRACSIEGDAQEDAVAHWDALLRAARYRLARLGDDL
jgi:protein-tyrosine phosphatase